MPDALLGRDLKLDRSAFGLGLVAVDGDLGTAEGSENLAQALLVRLNTPVGELAGLGHPDYGSRLIELIGRPNTESTRNLVRLFILEAIRREPRVAEVPQLSLEVLPQRPDRVEISLTVRPIDSPTPLNLVFSVNLEATP